MKNLFKEIEKESLNERTLIDKAGNFHNPDAVSEKLRKDFAKALMAGELPTSLSFDDYRNERIIAEYVPIQELNNSIVSILKRKTREPNFDTKEETDTPAVN